MLTPRNLSSKKCWSKSHVFLFSVILSFLTMIAVSCRTANFVGAENTRKNSQGQKKGGDNVPNQGTADPANDGNPVGGIQGNTGDNGTNNISNINGGGDNGNSNINGGGDQCKNANQWNVVLIFDNSNSQAKTDPNLMRRQGGINFVNAFITHLNTNPTFTAKFAVISFNSNAKRIGGWVDLRQNHDQVGQNIINGTYTPIINNSGIGTLIGILSGQGEGGTRYSPALQEAAKLYGELGTSVNELKQRNYIVFLTDGAPNLYEYIHTPTTTTTGETFIYPGPLETMQDITNAVTNLVQNYGVAINILATGQNLGDKQLFQESGVMDSGVDEPTAEQIAKNLAQPTVGIKRPSHIGTYLRVKTVADSQSYWDQLFQDLINCQ